MTASDVMRRVMTAPITANERRWIEFIRLASFDSDPPPTLERVKQLRRVFEGSRSSVASGELR